MIDKCFVHKTKHCFWFLVFKKLTFVLRHLYTARGLHVNIDTRHDIVLWFDNNPGLGCQ